MNPITNKKDLETTIDDIRNLPIFIKSQNKIIKYLKKNINLCFNKKNPFSYKYTIKLFM